MSRFRHAAAAVPESAPVDELVSVANRGYLSPLVQNLNAGSADIGRVCGVLASMADIGDLLMHWANKARTLGALHPIVLCA
jgi:hypothetical protein